MTVHEIDEIVNWVKSNVLDSPATDNDIAFETLDVDAATQPESTAEQVRSRPSLAEMNAPAEYDFPLSLLEDILGLNRVEN